MYGRASPTVIIAPIRPHAALIVFSIWHGDMVLPAALTISSFLRSIIETLPSSSTVAMSPVCGLPSFFSALVAGELADRFLGLTAKLFELVLRLIRTAHSVCCSYFAGTDPGWPKPQPEATSEPVGAGTIGPIERQGRSSF